MSILEMKMTVADGKLWIDFDDAIMHDCIAATKNQCTCS